MLSVVRFCWFQSVWHAVVPNRKTAAVVLARRISSCLCIVLTELNCCRTVPSVADNSSHVVSPLGSVCCRAQTMLPSCCSSLLLVLSGPLRARGHNGAEDDHVVGSGSHPSPAVPSRLFCFCLSPNRSEWRARERAKPIHSLPPRPRTRPLAEPSSRTAAALPLLMPPPVLRLPEPR